MDEEKREEPFMSIMNRKSDRDRELSMVIETFLIPKEESLGTESDNKMKMVTEKSNSQGNACEICPFTTLSLVRLKRHVNEVHLNIKKFDCTDCGYAFSRKEQLDIHKSTAHLKVRDFVCKDCGSAFFRKSHLVLHTKMVHLKIKDHSCDQCE